MCRLAWQLLGMLGNVLGLLGMLRNVLGMLCNVLGMLTTSSASSACFPQGPRSPTSKKYPPTCCLISCEAKGVVYHQASINGERRWCYFCEASNWQWLHELGVSRKRNALWDYEPFVGNANSAKPRILGLYHTRRSLERA